ncbi:GNAT family N-acetyltransferase [Microlunatus soli]|uniref:Ribosomal-protein-alanine N-acetyltransferase n=1 Tax=Microlunatus soli TaxID=630515 RepID=A0A1H1QZS3_9ACTN|nr:GNAT family N-acetyltransferase [Microlunatus soli]SDS29024.1 ribosomal-protein-alanine N-acetyltransferase [Microlunatus soli]
MALTQHDAVDLELLSMEHRDRLEQFERANREFFARYISDRGNDYFAHFTDRLAALVAENDTARSLCFVLVTADGRIVGRVNIYDIDQPELTEIGFRVAADQQGKGLATYGVLAALEQARARGVRSVAARVALDNPASHRVLTRCGFASTGPAATPAESTRTFTGYRILLEAGPTQSR